MVIVFETSIRQKSARFVFSLNGEECLFQLDGFLAIQYIGAARPNTFKAAVYVSLKCLITNSDH